MFIFVYRNSSCPEVFLPVRVVDQGVGASFVWDWSHLQDSVDLLE